MEKLLNKQLAQYLSDGNILDHSQFGFREGHGTETALLTEVEELRSVLDPGGKAALVL